MAQQETKNRLSYRDEIRAIIQDVVDEGSAGKMTLHELGQYIQESTDVMGMTKQAVHIHTRAMGICWREERNKSLDKAIRRILTTIAGITNNDLHAKMWGEGYKADLKTLRPRIYRIRKQLCIVSPVCLLEWERKVARGAFESALADAGADAKDMELRDRMEKDFRVSVSINVVRTLRYG